MSVRSRIAGCAARLRRADEGQALVEFALIVPFLLVFLVGIVEFGRAWNLHQVLTDAAREGARKAVVHDPTITLDSVNNVVKQAIATAGANPTSATITVTGLDDATGDPATVEVAMPYQFIFFGALKKWTTGESTVTLRTRFTMRNE
jgi:Flp pilus assembly protein TadG